MTTTIKTAPQMRHRIAEIKLSMAQMKNNYFTNRISAPMEIRSALEMELCDLNLQLMDIDAIAFKRRMHMKTRMNELVRAALDANGLPHVWEECRAQAESEFPQLTESQA